MNRDLSELRKRNALLEKYISNLEKDREEIKQNLQLEDAILSHIGEGMAVVDVYGKILILNEAAKELLNIDLGNDIKGNDYYKIIKVRGDNGERVYRKEHPIHKVFSTGKKVYYLFTDNLYMERIDGSTFPVIISASPVKIQEKLTGVVMIFHDATREKEIENIKSDFISIVSHQLRTPLTVSNLHSEMLIAGHGGKLNPDQKELVEEIQFYNKKMSDLLSVFLSVSRMELDKQTGKSELIDIKGMLMDIFHELGLQIKAKKIRVDIKYLSSLQEIKTDPEFLRVALQNLISNSIKYSPPNSHIKVSVEDGENNIQISIKDEGHGIPQKDHGKVFSKIFRSRSTQEHGGEEGTGLGLYITKKVIEKIGGSVWFNSEENKGSDFYISIPVK